MHEGRLAELGQSAEWRLALLGDVHQLHHLLAPASLSLQISEAHEYADWTIYRSLGLHRTLPWPEDCGGKLLLSRAGDPFLYLHCALLVHAQEALARKA